MSVGVRIPGAVGSKNITLWLCICVCFVLVQPAAGDAAGLPQIIDQLVLACNNQDAAAYRKTFSEKLKSEFSLERVKDILSTNMNGNGPIISHKTELSPDGKRALLFLEMENSAFDVHIRLNDDNLIERLTWFPHKTGPSETSLSGHERHLIQEKYQPYVDKFMQAIRDTNAETMLSLMAKDEDDNWSFDDHRSFLIQMNDRGIRNVGEIEVLAHNEVLVPVYFETGDMGFYLGFDKANKISTMRISNYAPSESHGVSYTSLGPDTLRTLDLQNFDQLRDTFAADSGKVRFIALLSPT